MTNDLVCGFFSISETVLSGSHIASSSARVSACLELPQQLRQLGDISSDASGFVAGERPGRCARIVEMHIGELLAFAVAHHEVMHRIAGRKTGRCPFSPELTKLRPRL